MPTLRQLRLFEAVARLESVSAAAAEVRLSQPAVTQTLGKLEREVGASLLQRRRSGSYPTPAGIVLLKRTERLLRQMRDALCAPAIGAPFADDETIAALVAKITDTQVRSLIAVAASRSFDDAARRLGIAEPSLHRAARTLERNLRRTLYRRTAHGLTATPQAAELARRFRVALREIDYALDELNAERGRFASRLVVGNIPHSDVHLLSAAADVLLARFPTVSIHIVEGQYDTLLAGLRDGTIDLLYGVLRLPEWAGDVQEQFLFANPYTVVGRRGHPMQRANRVTKADLARFGWIMPPAGTPRRAAFERLFAGSAPPTVGVETTSMDIYRALLRSSDRLALFSQREMAADRTAGLEPIRFRSTSLQRADGVAFRKDWQPTSLHTAFLDTLRAKAAGRADSRRTPMSASGRID